ncbi:winged helix-turn-helix domain-containing protein [Sphingomicrobium flavum]|uniref:winged helix-turn-helix domain-containing protein n=1 Tax=Sphingomicrobium flavum TaxID=1229164 RepID=UPI0021ADC70F|nr:winged helix-turn-helix domain-containing protein [Sphingomicrobium flavum]
MDAPKDNFEPLEDRAALDLAHVAPFCLGELQVFPAERVIRRGDHRAELEPKVMKLLVILGQDCGHVFSPDDLIDLCWDGRIVGDSAITRVVSLLRNALADVAGNRVRIANVRKVGYRLELAGGAHDPATTAATARWPLVAGIVGLLLAALAIWQLVPSAPASPVSLVILSATQGDEEDRMVGSGLAAALADSIQQANQIEVTGRISAATLQDQGISPVEIGRRLGVDYIVVTRLDRAAGTRRFSVELFKVEAGSSIFQRARPVTASELALVPALAARDIVQRLDIDGGTAAASGLAEQADAQLYMLASSLIDTRDGQQVARAVTLLRQFTARNPDYAPGWAMLAKALRLAPAASQDQRIAMSEEATGLAEKALAMDPDSPSTLKVHGLLASDTAQRLQSLERMVALDPYDAEAWIWLANARMGRGTEGSDLDAMRRSLALEPLWNRAWQAASNAANYGRLDLADTMDERVIAVADQHWQADYARARIAQRRGDLSQALRLGRLAMLSADPGSKALLTHQLKLSALLTNRPPLHDARAHASSPVSQIITGILPADDDLRAAGMGTHNLWQLGPALAPYAALLVRNDRHQTLIAAYDEAYAKPGAFVSAMEARENGPYWAATMGAYVGWSLAQEGRQQEARQIFTLARAAIQPLVDDKREYVRQSDLFAAASLYAAAGDAPAAAALVQRLMKHGWPFSYPTTLPAIAGPLTDDPLFAKVRPLVPELDEIEKRIEKERREAR